MEVFRKRELEREMEEAREGGSRKLEREMEEAREEWREGGREVERKRGRERERMQGLRDKAKVERNCVSRRNHETTLTTVCNSDFFE